MLFLVTIKLLLANFAPPPLNWAQTNVNEPAPILLAKFLYQWIQSINTPCFRRGLIWHVKWYSWWTKSCSTRLMYIYIYSTKHNVNSLDKLTTYWCSVSSLSCSYKCYKVSHLYYKDSWVFVLRGPLGDGPLHLAGKRLHKSIVKGTCKYSPYIYKLVMIYVYSHIYILKQGKFNLLQLFCDFWDSYLGCHLSPSQVFFLPKKFQPPNGNPGFKTLVIFHSTGLDS